MTGRATANILRACRGTAVRGRSEASTPGRRGAVSGDRQHGHGGDGGGAQEQPPDQVGGRRRVLDQRAGAQPAEGKAHQGGGAADHRPAPAAVRLQVDQRCAGRAGRGADGGALQRPSGEQQPDAVRCQEQPARARAGRQGHRYDSAAAQVVR
jgi:hypothetical protein